MKPERVYEDSEVVSKGPCEKCGSSDGNVLYSDNHTYCFVCQTSTGGGGQSTVRVYQGEKRWTPLEVTAVSFESTRGVTEKTASFFGYGKGEFKGQPCHVAPYFTPEGELCAQKLRFADKTFLILGSLRRAGLFGQNKWRDSGRKVVITEGEIDCLSMAQVQDLKWPVVSVPNGAAGAAKALARSIDWLSEFDDVILMFDMDDVGQAAARECAELFRPGQAKIAKLPLKDPNEMLKAKRYKEMIDAIWGAKAVRPDGIVSGSEMRERLQNRPIIKAWNYPWPAIQEMTLGLREEEIVTLTAGSGVGKSQISKELIYSLQKQGAKIGCICLEESAERTSEILIGMEMGERVHLNVNPTRDEKYWAAFDKTVGLQAADGNDTLYLYDHWGSTDGDNLMKKIRYFVRGCGCNFILLDHISIVVSGIDEGNERRIIDNLMTTVASLTRELKMGLILISHLKRPDGKGHEEGGLTSLSQLRGSAAIGQLSDIVIGAERNQQHATDKNVTQLRLLKNRLTGDTGKCGCILFDKVTGRLNAIETEDDEIFNGTEASTPY
jgi:twinkle protein